MYPPNASKSLLLRDSNGGFQGRMGFAAMVDRPGFLCKEICYCKSILTKYDTSVAIATSGRRTTLLVQEHPHPNTPHSISRFKNGV